MSILEICSIIMLVIFIGIFLACATRWCVIAKRLNIVIDIYEQFNNECNYNDNAHNNIMKGAYELILKTLKEIRGDRKD